MRSIVSAWMSSCAHPRSSLLRGRVTTARELRLASGALLGARDPIDPGGVGELDRHWARERRLERQPTCPDAEPIDVRSSRIDREAGGDRSVTAATRDAARHGERRALVGSEADRLV